MSSVSTPTEPRYTPVAIVLHWVLALSILTAFGVGLYLDDLPFSPAKLKMINWHKWAGITILALSVLRLVWRWLNPPPPLPARMLNGMPRWQQIAHHGTHHLMYLLFFVVPLAGWAYSSAKGYPIVWFGVLPLPDLMAPNKALADTIKEVHAVAAFGLIGLVALHVAAVIKHQFIDKDGLLDRMRLGR
ncbi:MAG: cytochrome b [Acidobacteriota bacterium]